MLVAIHGGLGHPLSAGEQELIVSATTVGAILGSLCAGRLADWIGRKKVMLGAALFFLVGGLEQAASQVVQELVLGRGIQGIAVGMASMVTPTFLAEVAPSDVRGRLVGVNSLLITGGQVVAYAISALFYHTPLGWRWMALSGCVPAVVQLISLVALDESPRWLVHQGRVSQARHVLGRIYSTASFTAIEEEITRITNTFGQTAYEAHASNRQPDESAHAVTIPGGGIWHELWSRCKHGSTQARRSIKHGVHTAKAQLKLLLGAPANRRALELAAGLLCFQQAVGFNSLMYFSGRLLFMVGFENPNAMAMGIAIANLAGTVGAIRLVDSVGRRSLLLYTIALAAGSLAFLAIALQHINLKDVAEQVSPNSSTAGFASGSYASSSQHPSASPDGQSGWAYVSLAAVCTCLIFFSPFLTLSHPFPPLFSSF